MQITIATRDWATTKTGKQYAKVVDTNGAKYNCWLENVAKQLNPGTTLSVILQQDPTGKFSPSITAASPNGIAPIKQFEGELNKQNFDDARKKENQEKNDSIRVLNSINNAVLLIAHGKVDIDPILGAELTVEAVANKLYRLKVGQ